MGGETLALRIREVLADGSTQFAVLADEHVREALRAALLGPFLPGVEGAARLVGAAGHDYRADVGRPEDTELGVGEIVGALDELEPESKVRLV